MSRKNGNLSISCHHILKETEELTGEKLVIMKLVVEEKNGQKRKAVVYLGKSQSGNEHFEMSGTIHLTPFNGLDAANAATNKAISNIRKMTPNEVFVALARV